MKKIVVILFLSLLTGYSVSAQNFRFGLTASPLFSWFGIGGDDVQSDGVKLGFQYGLLFETNLGPSDNYVFSSGVIVNTAGGFLKDVDSLNTYYSTIRCGYIEVPLSVKLRTNEVNYMRYYGQFGLTPGINIKARYDMEDANGNELVKDYNLREETATGDKYNLFNLSLTVGLGAEFSITETTIITGGIFFQNGFLNVMDFSTTDENIQLKQLGLRLGVLF